MGQFSTRPPHSALPTRRPKDFAQHAGKGFLVTGAVGGVGRATAARLAARGARVALADIRADAQLRRHMKPDEFAGTISFLLSDDAVIVCGQALNADGGETPY